MQIFYSYLVFQKKKNKGSSLLLGNCMRISPITEMSKTCKVTTQAAKNRR